MVTPDDAARVISLIDLTDLNDAHDPVGLDSLVERATEAGVPAVCVWPDFISAVRHPDRHYAIATVVNFPSGDDAVADVVALTRDVLDAGANEVDLVAPYRAFRAGDRAAVSEMVGAVADIVHPRGAHLKVILETGEARGRDAIVELATLAVDAGADFIKTSTGKTSTGATLDALDAMIDVVAASDRPIGLKPSGGIATVADAMRYLDLVEMRLGPQWATPSTFRFGASSLLADAVSHLT